MGEWITPAGCFKARVVERYKGLRGQDRIALCGPMGRVFHFDASEVRQVSTAPPEHPVLRPPADEWKVTYRA